jgi:cytochrome c-type biogenesis protein
MLCRTEETHCTTHVPVRRRAGFGGSFLLGASFALVLSPCCTPLVIVILAYTSTSGDPWYGSALLAIFAVGHALPLLGIGAGAQRVGALLARPRLKSATSTAAATLMLSLAAYYAVLA